MRGFLHRDLKEALDFYVKQDPMQLVDNTTPGGFQLW